MRTRIHGTLLRLTVLCVLAISAGLAVPATAEDTVALLEDFTVRDESPEEALLDDVAIVRADSQQQEPGRRGLPLVAGDEVRTGPGCSAVLRFLDVEAEVQPLLMVGEDSVVRIEGPSSVRAMLGRLFATLKGFFTVVTTTGQLGVEGTEFEVVVDAEGSLEEVRVLEGVVDLSDALEIRPLERLTVTGAGSRPEPMAEAEVRAAVDWTNDVWVQSQPSWAAPGDPPRFATAEDRAEAFREARFDAIWRQDPEARARLGDLFNDWGEGTRAIVAYRDAAAAKPELERSADFLASLSQANRRAGRLDEAEAVAKTALDRQPDSGRARLALGNALADRARFDAGNRDRAANEELLKRALAEYRRAEEIWQSAGASRDDDRRARSTTMTSAARSRGTLASLAAREQLSDRADSLVREAQKEARRAQELDPGDPFSILELGATYQQRARLARKQGDEKASREALDEAEHLYDQALDRYRDLAPARYRLGTVWEERGPEYRDSAVQEYQRAIEAKPTYSPAYYRLGTLLAEDEPEASARYLDIYRKITPDALEIPTMPDLTDMQLDDALLRITKLGLRLDRVEVSQNPAAAGTVRDQSPRAGAVLGRGTAVILAVAAPDGPSPMPDLIGLTESAARNRIALAGLTLGEIKDKEEKGRTSSAVAKQSPKAGKKVEPGREVDLTMAVPKGTTKVPDLLGETSKAAAKKIGKKKLTLGDVGEEPSCAGEGTVVRQSPEKNRRVAPGTVVDLVLASAGADPRVVPRLTGLAGERAETALRKASLQLAQVQHQESERPEGTVLAQLPVAGTRLPAGCPVALTLAKPIPLVTVPDLVGSSEAAVRNAFASRQGAFAYLRGGRVVTVQTRRVAAGTVVQQNPQAGARVRRGTVVGIWVEARAATVTPPPSTSLVVVPNVRCQPLETAHGIIKNAGLTPKLVGSGDVAADQSPAAGTRVQRGTTVTLRAGSTGRCIR
ncbi:MAG: PASTA domain-containing protein [bacterium]|nr:PASTA domain-containing protein [bacterium]